MILSVLDLNDNIYDTAVFADALRTSNESAATCVRGSQAIGPGLAITGPGPGFTSRSRFPTLTGTAGNAAGRRPTVTVRIFNGADTSGALVTTLSAPRAAPRGRSRRPRRSRQGRTRPRPRRRAPTAAPASARR